MSRILVVDDSVVERHLAGALLAGRLDFEIVYAEDGRHALQQLQRMQIDLVVTDLVMPGMDGLELLQTIRRDYPHIPVVLMTAYGNEAIAVDALEQGAASYVPKARQAERLLDTVRRVLGRKQSDRKPRRRIDSVGKIEATFYLENDPDRIEPLVDFVQTMLLDLGIGDENECLRTGIALEEALLNALYHGNLEIGDEELHSDVTRSRNELLRELSRQRRDSQPYSRRRIVVDVHLTTFSARFIVRDEGKGFPRTTLSQEEDASPFNGGNGWGISLMNLLMDEVNYSEAGNEVTMIKVVRRSTSPAEMRHGNIIH